MWLKDNYASLAHEGSIITTIPSHEESKIDDFFEWKKWFVDMCASLLEHIPLSECVLLFQPDIKIINEKGYQEWVDTAYMCNRACDSVPSCRLVFHKIISNHVNITDYSTNIYKDKRVGYIHLMCYRKQTDDHEEQFADVVANNTCCDGVNFESIILAVKYAKHIGSRCIIDPFCRRGDILAVANYFGLNSIGLQSEDSLLQTSYNISINQEKNGFLVEQ
eukprot:TRINITY_DN5509_c0_g1_i2.p1 TRINITY_DN5509_c0_g1~~TRINITY_DN5509_c0_g1_i2.p1  ORF type:complete len:220 (-),score=46.83 TRINITY_DN5509_c0_g1_i2:18-677(-)